ncbi:MAG: diphosphomevalonate decarboxylase [Methanomassiliicoccales archaeon]
MKSTAMAHPIQGLIKYHGLRDEGLRLPFHDSISVCTGPLHTRTTVEFGHPRDSMVVDGQEVNERERERILAVVDPLRELAGGDGFRMVSRNSFQSNIGLGASASGFAALAVATASALGLDMDLEEISRYARRGAGSAARAVTGGFSRWFAGQGDEDSFSKRIPSPAEEEMGILVAIIPARKFTDTAHRDVLTSPFFKARLEYVEHALEEMQTAITRGYLREVGELAERDTLLLHGITMTGSAGLILWRPETLSVILEVKRLAEEGVECHFSIDTGATVYINTTRDSIPQVRERIGSLGMDTLTCGVGGEARLVDDHLF